MDNGKDIDLSLIAESCELNNAKDPQTTISRIENLKTGYPDSVLINIFNYMLSKAQDPDVLAYLIQCLDKYRDSSTLPILVNILLLKNTNTENYESKEKYTKIRTLCARAIGNQKNTDYVTSLLYCLNNKNENYRIRLACADALGKIGDKYAVAPLIEVAKDENEKSVYVRESAVSALGLLGDTRAIDPLVSILETKQSIINKFSFLKERVIEALDKMGLNNDDRIFKALKNSLLDESIQVRIDAIEAIMNSEHPKAYDTIRNCLENDQDEEVKKNALIALYNLSDRAILDEVISSEKYSENLKKTASEILEENEDD